MPNPCYNGYGVHLMSKYTLYLAGCNPCYNGYGGRDSVSQHYSSFFVLPTL